MCLARENWTTVKKLEMNILSKVDLFEIENYRDRKVFPEQTFPMSRETKDTMT